MSKKPVMSAVSRFGCENFDQIVAWYMLNGYIYIGPEAFILAQKCSKSSILNEQKVLDKTDCWFIQYASGEINRFFEVCPEELEWVCFQRGFKGRYRFYKFDKLRKRLQNGITRHSEAEKGTTACD